MKELEGTTFDLRSLQAREDNDSELYNYLFEGEQKVLTRLTQGIGQRVDEAYAFSKKLKNAMDIWAKLGNNTKAINLIKDIETQLSSSSKKLQRYLLEGKGNIKTDVSWLFHEKGATYDTETKTWDGIVQYSGKPSIDILLDIYKHLNIKVIKSGEHDAGLKGIQSHYSLDVDTFVNEVYSLIEKSSANPAEHYKLFFNSDNILRMIYRLVPDMVYHSQEKMSDGEKENILTKHFDVLEYLIRINSLTGDYNKLKENRLKSVKRMTKLRSDKSPLKMNRHFQELETAWNLYQDNPSKHSPETVPRKDRTSPTKDAPKFGIRGTTYAAKYLGPKTLEEWKLYQGENKTLEEKINEFSGKVKVVAEESKLGKFPENILNYLPHLNTTKDKLLEQVKSYQKITDEYKVSLQGLVDGSNPHNIPEEEIEEDKKLLEEWIEYYEQELPKVTSKIETIDRLLENLPTQQQSLDEPSSDEATGESQ